MRLTEHTSDTDIDLAWSWPWQSGPVCGATVWRHPAGGLNHEGAVTRSYKNP